MPVTFQKTNSPPAIVAHIGSVQDVIRASLPPEMTSRRYHAGHYLTGFELATPKKLPSVGEAVLVNDLCFTNSTDASSEDYDKTIAGEEFTSGGVFLIPKGTSPTHHFEVKGDISMIDLYQRMDREAKRPVAFGALLYFSTFHGTAIGKPPIDGHNIFEFKQEYYPNPDVYAKGVWGFVMGVLSSFEGHPEVNRELETVLYKNPMDQAVTLVHHAHVLLLKKKVDLWEEIVPSIVDRTLHLFIDGTSVSAGKGELFAIGKVEDHLMRWERGA